MAEEAFATYRTRGLPEAMQLALGVQQALWRQGFTAEAREVAAIIDTWDRAIDAAAVEMAGASEGAIVARIATTMAANRPHRGEMETHIRSIPGPLGFVAVGIIGELDKIVNPVGPWGKPFWPAQEFGTGVEGVPSMEGRVLFGLFQPSGTRPKAGENNDLRFVSNSVEPNVDAGFGTVGAELPGRHFLRDGAAEVGAKYIVRMGEICESYLREITAVVQRVRARQVGGGAGRFTAVFEM